MGEQGVGAQPRLRAVVKTKIKTISLQHSGIKFVMQFFKHPNQALGVDGFFFGLEFAAFFKSFKYAVRANQRKVGVGCLLAFVVHVDLLG